MVCTRIAGCNSQSADSFGLEISLYFCAVLKADYLSTVRVINKSPTIAKLFYPSNLKMPNLCIIEVPIFLNRLHPKPQLTHSEACVFLLRWGACDLSSFCHLFYLFTSRILNILSSIECNASLSNIRSSALCQPCILKCSILALNWLSNPLGGVYLSIVS